MRWKNMPMKIYVRERMKVKTGVKAPRFRVLAVTNGSSGADGQLTFLTRLHLRKVELEQIAKDVGAEVVYLEPIEEKERGKMK
jgi:hypothetical protein